MPRPAKGARLWLQPEERDEAGRLRKRSVWVIRDGAHKISTGCAPQSRAAAEQQLADYIVSKYQAPRERGRHPAQVRIADILTIYLQDVAPEQARPKEVGQRILTLAEWWGEKTLSEVNGRACRDYVEWRTAQLIRAARPEKTGKPARLVTAAAARRELEDLRAAINHHRREGLCSEVVEVTLPPKSAPRERWLTRAEAARILWAAWTYREIQKGVETDRRSRRHITRFLLVGLYTGTRSAAICAAGFDPENGRSWVDLERGVFYRRSEGARQTKKRQPPVRLPNRLLAHIRRWKDTGIANRAVVEFNGEPVGSIRKAFANCVAAAGLGPEVTPHILRHTCATWMMQNGVDLWEAASFLGMTVQQLEATYGHHHPDHQAQAAEAVTAKRPAVKPRSNVVGL
ncbi:tyrosine-type recombinase/integrase [Xanthobacter versatilis]|uniref:tyrosine-type recombinase/integrase n=1 Tax=Xanthobacter autotrophicus (strain ATCC BAA-1158 / Py2) TaxID=78245 RepID=UPI0037282359